MGRLRAWRPPPWYAPPGMVARCTELRGVGNWRTAAWTAGFEVDIHLAQVEQTHGAAAVPEVEALLAALTPDLLRQYLGHPSTYTYLHPGEDRDLLLVVWDCRLEGRYLVQLGLATGLTRDSDVLPVWCWRADAVEERRRAYAERAAHTEDVELLEDRRLTADELHPLVHQALHPGRVQRHAWRELWWPPVRVRCVGEQWHELTFVGGRLTALAHPETADPETTDPETTDPETTDPETEDPATGCAAVLRAWRAGAGLPRRLAEIRDDVFRRARLGCTEEVVAALDAGFDPAAPGPHGRTLMHYLGYLDPVPIWPRLLAAQVPVDTVDAGGRTPMDMAVWLRAYEVIRLLPSSDPDQTRRWPT
jgi:hypothetical protein